MKFVTKIMEKFSLYVKHVAAVPNETILQKLMQTAK